MSSTSVYGSTKDLVDEKCSINDLNPQSPYAFTKLAEEKFILDLSKNRGLKATTCRFGTIFGSSVGMRFHTAVNKFCWQAALKEPITVWKTAMDQYRPYLALTDACSAIDFFISKTFINDKNTFDYDVSFFSYN